MIREIDPRNRFCVASRRDVVREAKERFCFVADRVSNVFFAPRGKPQGFSPRG
jgi:hypothetical protein